jgi:hypothetical protein
LRDRVSQSHAAKGEQGLILAHSGTTPPYEHVPRPAHREMIPSRVNWASGRTQEWLKGIRRGTNLRARASYDDGL